ncbi:hypothetical protein [uncultured Draconibacterium sp.]|uniref:hypothetical protein n=1 Tax=uncultured Draconibacterium sp. TaxID=1573823 RepID=UPI0029C0BB91|nr:hypothetical protein [uncultured Draconibacterium sp.]
MKNLIIPLFILVVALISSCSKSELEIDREEIIGVWVAQEITDTLEFTSDQIVYKNSIPYEYHLEKDSIQMQYAGPLYIASYPFKLRYSLSDDILNIFCPDGNCYGFYAESVEYHRVD